MPQEIGKKNMAVSALLNIIRRACMIAFPLITYAYATRVLGAEGIGIYEFSQSIVNYFALVAALGITQYAVRDGAAYFREDGHKLDTFASEIFSINLIMTFVSYGIMFVLVSFNPLLSNYKIAIFIYSISILFTTIGVDWINSLFEDYLKLTVRYIVVSVIALVAMFVFVRTPQDIYKYIFISIFATVANGFMNFIYVQRHVKLRFTLSLNLAKHGMPIFILFCNNIASVIYLNSDITILGILTDDETVGLYGVASKIYSMIKELINAAIFVTIPRFSMYVSETIDTNDVTKKQEVVSVAYQEGLRKLLSPLFTMLVPACVGLFILSDNVMNIVAGSEFVDGGIALRILACAMFFAVMACFLAYAIIMPYKLEKYFLIATSVAAVVNCVLNFVLIPVIGMPAAALTTLLAEIMVFVFLLIISLSRINAFGIVHKRDYISSLVGSAAVAVICLMFGRFVDGFAGSIIWTLVTVVIAAVAYFGIIIALGNSVKEFAGKIIKK